MERKRIAAGACAFALAASLIAADTLPAFAAASERLTEDRMQVVEEGFADEAIVPSGDTEAEDLARTEILDAPEEEPEIVSILVKGEEQEATAGVQENSDGLIYVDGALYNGYYMDSASMMYIVSHGVAEPKDGTVGEGTAYYSYSDNGIMTLPKQTVFVAGKVYTGYYADSKDKMYHVKKGTRTLKTGVANAGTRYYSYNAKETLTLSKETLYVKGKVYTGYYMSGKNKMYRVKKGTRTLKTGTVNAGTKYYSYNKGKVEKLPKQTLYVKGKVYTGYYMSGKNKMYRVKKGTCTLANTTLNAGAKYYSYHAKKTLKLSKQTVFVNGKAMEGMSAESLATLKRAQAVVARITNDSMAKEEKLKACFEFVKTYQGGRPRIPHYMGMDWPVVYANDMFLNDGKGNCFSYAAAFAYMAKAIGYEEVYCCSSGGHGWAEIDGLIYDPERNKFDPAYSYYAISYDTKTNVDHKGGIAAGQPWMHIKI